MMTSIITCPGCASQLTVAESAAADSRVQCPQCEAEFSMCETIQLALPAATVLPPATPAPEDTTELESSEQESAGTLSPDAPLSSWEARIKNAISGVLEEEGVPAPATTPEALDVTQEEEPAPTFELPKPWEKNFDTTEPSVETQTDPEPVVPTLSFSATTEVDESNVEYAGEAAEPSRSEVPARASAPVGPGKVRNRSLTRLVGTFVLFPIVGLGLGFYSLTWLLGPEADYIGLSRILPSSLMPSTDKEDSDINAQPLPKPTGLANESTELDSPIATVHDPSVVATNLSYPLTTQALPKGVSAAEFRELVSQAQTALPGFTMGNAQEQGVLQQKAKAYMSLCRLAEKFDFIHQLGLSPQANQQVQLGKEIFHTISAEPHLLQDLSQVASLWWNYGERRNQGIFFAGRIAKVASLESGQLCHVTLPATGEVFPVLFEQTAWQQGQTVAVVGRVDSSSQALPGGNVPVPNKVVQSQYCYALTTP